MKEFEERFKIISYSPVKVFLSSYNSRYYYPYRLQHAGAVRPWIRKEALQIILDSGINDPDIGNQETLDAAAEVNADFVVPADVLGNQKETTEAVYKFLELYSTHECSATPLIPLQPPYDRHYEDLSEYSHYVLGGIANAHPKRQIREIQKFREVAGPQPYAHALGLGMSLTVIRELRNNPSLVDSIDLSTPERIASYDKIADKTWSHQNFAYPTGTDSSTIRGAYSVAMALQLNYMLGELCDDDILESEYEQSTLSDL